MCCLFRGCPAGGPKTLTHFFTHAQTHVNTTKPFTVLVDTNVETYSMIL